MVYTMVVVSCEKLFKLAIRYRHRDFDARSKASQAGFLSLIQVC